MATGWKSSSRRRWPDMRRRLAAAMLVMFAGLLLAGCAGLRVPAADSGVAAQGSLQWVRSELYFGVGAEDGSATRVQEAAIGEAQWRAFLDAEVTPRFPDGLTVFEAYGQWRFRDAETPNRLRSKVLVILHEDTAQRRADIEAIRSAWKQATQHESVLWAREKVEVSF